MSDEDAWADDAAATNAGAIGAAYSACNLAAARSRVFQTLRPLCARLMQLCSEPEALHSALGELAAVLPALEPAGLQACLDYVAFPLTAILASVAAARQAPSSGGSHPGGGASLQSGMRGGTAAAGKEALPAVPPPAELAVPAARSDRAAEAVLSCLHALLAHCALCEADQLVGVAQRLLPLVALPRAAGGEEVRLGAVECLAAALRGSATRQQHSGTLQVRTRENHCADC